MKAITAFLVAVGIGVAAAFNADNWSSVGSLAKQTIAAPASAKDLFHAALIFQVAEAHAGQKATPNCQSLSDFTSRQSKLSDVAYAVRGSRLLGCSPPSSALDQLADSLKSSRLTDLFHAVGGLNKNSDAAEVSRVIDTVLSLQEGVLFRTSKKSRASVLAAGLAFHVLSDVARHLDSSLSSTHKKQLSDVLKSAPSLLATAKRNEDGTLTLSDNDPLLVTYLALTGVHSLAVTLGEVSPIAVPTDTLSGLAAMLQPYASSGDVVAVGQSLAALQTLCKGAPQVFRAVLVVESQSPVVEAGATGTNGDLVVAVQDVFGFTPRSVQVKLNSVTTSNGAAVGALAGKTFTQEGNNFKVPFASSISEPGIYDAVVDVEVPGDAKWASGASTVRVKATGGIIVGPAFLHESRARQSDAKTRGTRVEFPDQSGKAFSIQERQYFHVAFEVKDSSKAPMSVHQVCAAALLLVLYLIVLTLLSFLLPQAFVAFTDRISGKTVTVVATPAETGLYAAVIEPSAFPASISSGKREFDVTAIIGDALVKVSEAGVLTGLRL